MMADEQWSAALTALAAELAQWRALALAYAPAAAIKAANLPLPESLGGAAASSAVAPISKVVSLSEARGSAVLKPTHSLSMGSEESAESSGPSPMKKGRALHSINKSPRPLMSGHLRPVRGFTAFGLAEMAADEESMEDVMEATVAPQPHVDPDHGEVTIVRVRTPDRPHLLADLTALLAGLGLSCAKAVITTDESGSVEMAVNEFWVQEAGDGGTHRFEH